MNLNIEDTSQYKPYLTIEVKEDSFIINHQHEVFNFGSKIKRITTVFVKKLGDRLFYIVLQAHPDFRILEFRNKADKSIKIKTNILNLNVEQKDFNSYTFFDKKSYAPVYEDIKTQSSMIEVRYELIRTLYEYYFTLLKINYYKNVDLYVEEVGETHHIFRFYGTDDTKWFFVEEDLTYE